MGERNKTTFWYALYGGSTEIVDEWGNVTADHEICYKDPVEMRANISPARGNASVEMFGDSLNYDKTIITSDMECPIDENTVLWVNTSPFDENGNIDPTVPYDYVVKKVAKSLTNISYAIKRVDVG